MRYTNLWTVSDIVNQKNPELVKSFLKVQDIGYNYDKDEPRFSANELNDLFALISLLNSEHELSFEQSVGYILGYVSAIGGLQEQFDVLRFGNDGVFNLELKHDLPDGGLSAIERQLRRHQLYLNILNPKSLTVCCYLQSRNVIFWINNSGEFTNIEPQRLFDLIELTNDSDHSLKEVDLTSMIVSPYVQPELFAQHKYFLTENQYQRREEILNSSKSRIVITGGPGTGKTLLLLDLAREYQQRNKTVIVIFCAPLENYEQVSNTIGIKVEPINHLSQDDLAKLKFDVILVDEAQRIYQEKLNVLVTLTGSLLILSMDKQQTLHVAEDALKIEPSISTSDILHVNLKGRVRYDPSLSSFIQRFLGNGKSGARPYHYKKVQLQYFSDKEMANYYITNKVRNEGYVSIEPTEYVTKTTRVVKRRKHFWFSHDVHHTIGREYDRVLVILDKHYCATKEGMEGRYINYYPYKQIAELFEALTRVRKDLLLVVINNPKLYVYIQKILSWKIDKEYFAEKMEKELGKSVENFSTTLQKDENLRLEFESLLDQVASFSTSHDIGSDELLKVIKSRLKNYNNETHH